MYTTIYFGKNNNMKRLKLIKNPDLFQGENYLNKNGQYFEGWYFKNTNKEKGISFIPGISVDDKGKKAFIQVITNDESYFVNYDIEDFEFAEDPFCIKIKNNTFSKDGIHIDIKEEKQNLNIDGDIKYTENQNIYTNMLNPNIMGPFSYIPFMECNHAILDMKNKASGVISVNNNKITFENDTGYIEKDWGTSFPKSYIWCQANNFQTSDASFMLSIADVPFKTFNFQGIICALIVEGEEYKFATYNNAKIIEYDVNDDWLNITLKKGSYTINVYSKYDVAQKLAAPVKGKMEKDIYESITATITVTLKKDDYVIFSDTSTNCGLEIVKS